MACIGVVSNETLRSEVSCRVCDAASAVLSARCLAEEATCGPTYNAAGQISKQVKFAGRNLSDQVCLRFHKVSRDLDDCNKSSEKLSTFSDDDVAGS